MRILIADDSERVRSAIRGLLIAHNRAVCGEAVNGDDALRKAQELLPDVILLDVSMPGRNGIETARQVREKSPGTRIILMSQHDFDQLAPFAAANDVAACVDKSRLMPDLLAVLEKLDEVEPNPSDHRSR
jgi:DNA-binding NarL/FixJ family response regulator